MVFETTLSEHEGMEDEYISQKTKLISNEPKVVLLYSCKLTTLKITYYLTFFDSRYEMTLIV